MKHRRSLAAALSQATRHDLPALAALLTLALLLWTLAYQVPCFTRLAIGGDAQTHRREDDAPFLEGFHAPEPSSEQQWRWWLLEPGYGYRWTWREATVHLPGVGGGHWIVSLHAGSGRPGSAPVTSTWQIGTQPPLPMTITDPARVYHFLTTSDPAGDLTISLDTPTYTPPDDPRELGFTLREVRVAPAVERLRPPALPHPGWLAAALALLYALLRWLLFGVRPALLLALAGALLLALLLALQRLALTLFSPTLAGLMLGGWGLALLAWLALGGWQAGWQSWHTRPVTRLLAPHRQTGAIIALALLAFTLRAGGMLHPHAIFSDHRLNANNLLETALGNIYFTEGLPDTRGGGDAPYPPGFYLLLAPAMLLLPPGADGAHSLHGMSGMESRVIIVQLGVALLDSLLLVLLWFLLRRAGLGQRAALFGAALYLLPPPIMASFSIGEYANLGGQALALPVIALLALGGLREQRVESQKKSVAFFVLPVLLSLGLLGHFGVAISLTLLFVAAWGLSVSGWLARRLRPGAAARPLPLAPGALTVGGLLAAAVVGCVYYSAPQFLDIYIERFSSDTPAGSASPADMTRSYLPLAVTAGAAPEPSGFLSDVAGFVVGLFDPGSRLLPLVLISGLSGLLLLWQWHSGRAGYQFAAFRTTLLAWWLGILLSFALLLIAAQGVRWQHFLYPALCLGGGIMLAALWRRGKTGRVLTAAVLAVIVAQGLIMWVWQVYDYLH